MPYTFLRVDNSGSSRYTRIWYRNPYGQERFFEFSEIFALADHRIERIARELVLQLNDFARSVHKDTPLCSSPETSAHNAELISSPK